MLHPFVASAVFATLIVLPLFPRLTFAQPSEQAAFRHEIRPGKIAEECRRVRTGELVRYSFRATQTVDFNIHFHRGNAVDYPVKLGNIAQSTSTFVAQSEEKYCWMWTNRAPEPVVVEGELVRFN